MAHSYRSHLEKYLETKSLSGCNGLSELRTSLKLKIIHRSINGKCDEQSSTVLNFYDALT